MGNPCTSDFQALAHGNSKNEIRQWTDEELDKKRGGLERKKPRRPITT